jgi:PAS domain S-box-containing protein
MNDNPTPPASDPQAEIALLIRRLHETEERLHVLTGGQVDKVVHPSGASYLLHGAQMELLKSEAAQRQLSTLQLAVLDALPAHIALLNEHGVVVAVNDAWRGFGSNNVFEGGEYGVGRNYIQICAQAHGECAAEAHQVGEGIRNVLQGKARNFSLEYPCHSPTQRQWFRVMVTPLHQGGTGGAVVMHVNVSERKLAEEALRESHERFHQLADSITDVFWIRSADLRVVHYVSPAFSRIWGRPVAALYANPDQWMDFILPDDRDRVRDAFAKLQRDAPSLDIEYRIVRPQGEIRWVRVRGFKVRDAAGKVIRYAGIVTDITEKRQVEAALRQSEQEQRELVKELEQERVRLVAAQQVAKVGSWETDLSTMAVIWSAETYRIFEADPETFRPTHQKFLEIVHPDDRALVDDAFIRSLPQRLPCAVEHRLLLPDGRIKFIEERWQVYHDDQGKPCRAVGTCQDISERKEAEREIDRQASFVRLNPNPVLELSVGGEINYFNEAATSMAHSLGYGRLVQMLPPGIAEITRESLATGTPRLRLETEQNGRTISWSFFPIPSKQAVHCYAGDITERKQAEQRAAEFQLFNQKLIETSPLAIITYRATGEAVTANVASARMLGAPDHLTIQAQNFRRIEFWQRNGMVAAAERALATGTICETEARGLNSFGRDIWLHAQFIPFTYGNDLFLLAIFDDIKERKLAQERLEEQAALLDIAHEAIMVKDLEDRIIFWNKGAESTYGWSAREALGSRSADLLKMDARQSAEARAMLLAKGEWNGELLKSTKDGRQLTVEARWTLVHDEQGQPKSIFAINTDITEKKKLEAQFFRAQRLESIGTLASGIAHDLNNVLAPILMSVDMLKSMVNDGHGQMVLSTLETSAQRGADLVKQVLTFARGIQGQRMEVNLGHLLRDVRQVVRETFPKNIQAVFKFAPDQWTVVGDPTQLHQVFMNLFVNARDAMPGGGKLEVTTENIVFDEVYADMNPTVKPGSYVLIEVADTGTGIPKEIRDRIFEPFFTTKEVGKGTGLGLSTVVSIVRSHGGFINVYSEVGRGTLFKLYLPAKMASTLPASATEQPLPPRGNGEWVLVVDDEDSILKVARKMLERYGYQVMTAVHGADAVAVYAQHRDKISVVLTDMAMPVMDGPATIIALKAMNPQIKIIGSSGHASNDGVAKALGAGVKHFIPKPYTAEKLLALLAQVVNEPA